MPRSSTYPDEIVDIPKNISVNQKGYVYYNSDTFWTRSKDSGHSYANHRKICIGKVLIPGSDWTKNPKMHPNQNYYRLFDTDKLPDAPVLADSVSVGLIAAVAQLSLVSGLTDSLVHTFGQEDTSLILDLAMYMLAQETAVFQHFPHWGRSHALFSETKRSDRYISTFEH